MGLDHRYSEPRLYAGLGSMVPILTDVRAGDKPNTSCVQHEKKVTSGHYPVIIADPISLFGTDLPPPARQICKSGHINCYRYKSGPTGDTFSS